MSLSDERRLCLTKFLHCVSTTNGLRHLGTTDPEAKPGRAAGREARRGWRAAVEALWKCTGSAAKNVQLDTQQELEEIFPSRLKNWLTGGLELWPKKLLKQFGSCCAYRSRRLYILRRQTGLCQTT